MIESSRRETELAQGGATVGTKAGDGHSRPSLSGLLHSRNFRLRLIGGGISVLGDQFYLIALPWLVLQLAGTAFAMGTVLALAGIPRALFMLVGGAMTDRFSPRAVMMASNALRAVVVALLAALVLTGRIELWMLYVFALVFGFVDAFFYPAAMAILPEIVDKEQLQAGNALNQGTVQVAMFVGPVLAGTLIAVLDGGTTQATASGATATDRSGMGVAFAIDCLGYVVSTVTLWMMRISRRESGVSMGESGVLSAIRDGLVSVWNDAPLRIFFLVIAAINLFVSGPLAVGIPVLANSRLPEGAAAFGVIMSAYGGGMLLGILLAGVLPKPVPRQMSLQLLAAAGVLGICLAILGIVSATVLAAAVSVVIGVTSGYTMILFMTWLQSRTPARMLGRMMSLLMFASVGVFPVSSAIAGALLDLNLTMLFVAAGSLIVVVVLVAALSPAVRAVGVDMAEVSDPSMA